MKDASQLCKLIKSEEQSHDQASNFEFVWLNALIPRAFLLLNQDSLYADYLDTDRKYTNKNYHCAVTICR